MEFISAENFLEQPEKVQDAFKVWLENNLNVHDWVKLIEEDAVLWVDSVMDTRKDNVDVGRAFYLGRCVCWSSIYEPNVVPLLTEGHLRKFIEEKTGLPIKLQPRYLNQKTQYQVISLKSYEKYYLEEDIRSKIYDDPLQAYWEVACKIAQEG